MAKVRTFIAIDIPAAQKEQIATLQGQLRALGARVTWTRPEGIHLTLKFLGDVDEGQIAQVAEAVGRAARGIEPFEVSIAGTGAFPDFRRPRVLWVGVKEPSGRLKALAQAVELQLQPLGFPREGRDFSPHLTLGRVKDPRGVEPVVRALQQTNFVGGSFAVQEVVVMRSDLKPSGAEYTALHRIALARD
ncbi:MAG: RNA 2',3'-cyclic phosphodiesterase [candidate division KSB1 bacterium]|nr:RNA 2',3'-cyclic phosphodiesterase [candidate division KSB1 bacterium]MDZ7385986.1 RNA 2',3'-cyclic phosphodiesterase [candidate division KSB1 bacterium]